MESTFPLYSIEEIQRIVGGCFIRLTYSGNQLLDVIPTIGVTFIHDFSNSISYVGGKCQGHLARRLEFVTKNFCIAVRHINQTPRFNITADSHQESGCLGTPAEARAAVVSVLIIVLRLNAQVRIIRHDRHRPVAEAVPPVGFRHLTIKILVDDIRIPAIDPVAVAWSTFDLIVSLLYRLDEDRRFKYLRVRWWRGIGYVGAERVEFRCAGILASDIGVTFTAGDRIHVFPINCRPGRPAADRLNRDLHALRVDVTRCLVPLCIQFRHDLTRPNPSLTTIEYRSSPTLFIVV